MDFEANLHFIRSTGEVIKIIILYSRIQNNNVDIMFIYEF
jgi:hypothetical protein